MSDAVDHVSDQKGPAGVADQDGRPLPIGAADEAKFSTIPRPFISGHAGKGNSGRVVDARDRIFTDMFFLIPGEVR